MPGGALGGALSPAVTSMLSARSAARAQKDYATSDELRNELRMKHNIQIDDTKGIWINTLTGQTGSTSNSMAQGSGG